MKSDIAYTHQKSFWHDLQLAFRATVFLLKLFTREVFGK